jgi:histone-lysine N-methyltransferase SETMAR
VSPRITGIHWYNYESIREGKTANKEMYTDILRHLRDAFRRQRREKWRTISRFLLLDNAPAHRSILVKGFFAKNNKTTAEHPPNSPDLTPTDFYLFPRLKSSFTGRRFPDSTDIIKNVTEELKTLSQNGLQKRFKQLYSCWQKCVLNKGTILKEM